MVITKIDLFHLQKCVSVKRTDTMPLTIDGLVLNINNQKT